MPLLLGNTASAGGSPTPAVDYLVVAGGGAGGVNYGGGGGAGGYLDGTSFSVLPTSTYTLTVGGGGGIYSGSGGNSVFSSVNAIGGGGGGNFQNYETPIQGKDGGSGGGGVGGYPTIISLGGSGTSLQGTRGGDGASWGNNRYTAGGGGGASVAGGNAVSGSRAGDGGAGIQSSITGIAQFYAGGGAGGWLAEGNTNIGVRAIGGSGVGGGWNGTSIVGPDGVANTGSGGCSAGQNTLDQFYTGIGNGGSGIVVIKYPDQFRDLDYIDPGLVYTRTLSGSSKIYRFTAGTGTVRV